MRGTVLCHGIDVKTRPLFFFFVYCVAEVSCYIHDITHPR